MKTLPRLALPAVIITAAACFLWPHVDRAASRVALSVAGLGLILAWYSILDLQEQRHERFWPHTVDRLMRATFTAITLVFVVNIALPGKAPAQVSEQIPVAVATQPEQATQEVRTVRFGDDIVALAQEHRWTAGDLQRVVAHHPSAER